MLRMHSHILGDLGAGSGGGEQSKQVKKKFGRGKVKNEKLHLVLDFSSSGFFLALFRLFPTPLTAPGSQRMVFT